MQLYYIVVIHKLHDPAAYLELHGPRSLGTHPELIHLATRIIMHILSTTLLLDF